MAELDVGIGILAGGKSRRMGRDKLFLTWQKKTFLERVLEECKGFSDIYLSVAEKADWAERIPVSIVVEDELKDYGPLEGIYQILKASKQEYVLMLAADMPYISSDLLNELKHRVSGTEDCLALLKDDYPEILCSIYSKRNLPVIEAMRMQGEHRPIRVFQRSNTTYVDIETLGYSKKTVTNINTPLEYEKLTGKAEEDA